LLLLRAHVLRLLLALGAHGLGLLLALGADGLGLLLVLRSLRLRLLDALGADLLALGGAGLDLRPFGAGMNLRPFGPDLFPRSYAHLNRRSPLGPRLLAFDSGLLTVLASLLAIGALRLRRSITTPAATGGDELRTIGPAATMTAGSGGRRYRDRQCGDTCG
jgi:hypothetical protein